MIRKRSLFSLGLRSLKESLSLEDYLDKYFFAELLEFLSSGMVSRSSLPILAKRIDSGESLEKLVISDSFVIELLPRAIPSEGPSVLTKKFSSEMLNFFTEEFAHYYETFNSLGFPRFVLEEILLYVFVYSKRIISEESYFRRILPFPLEYEIDSDFVHRWLQIFNKKFGVDYERRKLQYIFAFEIIMPNRKYREFKFYVNIVDLFDGVSPESALGILMNLKSKNLLMDFLDFSDSKGGLKEFLKHLPYMTAGGYTHEEDEQTRNYHSPVQHWLGFLNSLLKISFKSFRSAILSRLLGNSNGGFDKNFVNNLQKIDYNVEGVLEEIWEYLEKTLFESESVDFYAKNMDLAKEMNWEDVQKKFFDTMGIFLKALAISLFGQNMFSSRSYRKISNSGNLYLAVFESFKQAFLEKEGEDSLLKFLVEDFSNKNSYLPYHFLSAKKVACAVFDVFLNDFFGPESPIRAWEVDEDPGQRDFWSKKVKEIVEARFENFAPEDLEKAIIRMYGKDSL